MADYRIESDLLGELQVPADAYYGVQTQRALNNYRISCTKMSDYPDYVIAIAYVKMAAAAANTELGVLDKHIGEAIIQACREIVDGRLERAKLLGADYTINPLREDYKERMKELTEEGPNVIIDCVGLPQNLSEGVDILSFAGRYILMGLGNRADASYNMLWLTGKELDIVGSRMQRKRFIPVIENCREYLKNADLLVTDVYPFEEADKAMAHAAAAAPETTKVVVEFPD